MRHTRELRRYRKFGERESAKDLVDPFIHGEHDAADDLRKYDGHNEQWPTCEVAFGAR